MGRRARHREPLHVSGVDSVILTTRAGDRFEVSETSSGRGVRVRYLDGADGPRNVAAATDGPEATVVPAYKAVGHG